MNAKLQYQENTYVLKRYPKTSDLSLRAWSNAELLALDYIDSNLTEKIHLFNDRFGIWNNVLKNKKLTTIYTYASQQKAIEQNLKNNNFSINVNYKTPLDNLEEVDLALLKIPKSLELFELFLSQIHKASSLQTEVVCCFMTKYFSVSFEKIASQYFEEVTQTKAWKKARLLVLKHPKKKNNYKDFVNNLLWKNQTLKQYYGVFSAEKIDIGTQFLLSHLKLKSQEQKVLDVASGNGIIAFELAQQNPKAHFTLVDDFNLAVASSKINLKEFKADFVCDNSLENLPKNHFDLVVSNPPFHFEYENNIEVALTLFKEVKDCLVSNGRFVLVANKHLNYKTHLIKLFDGVEEVASNKKFVIYSCAN